MTKKPDIGLGLGLNFGSADTSDLTAVGFTLETKTDKLVRVRYGAGLELKRIMGNGTTLVASLDDARRKIETFLALHCGVSIAELKKKLPTAVPPTPVETLAVRIVARIAELAEAKAACTDPFTRGILDALLTELHTLYKNGN